MTWPRVFHRIWFDEPERPEFSAWRDRLADLHPDWEIRTWGSSAEVRDLIRDAELRAEFERYLVTDPFGRVPDIARYLLLWHFGGVYIDTDFEPLRSFEPLLEDPRPFAGWENDRTLCTALLAAPPKHPAIGVLLEGLVGRLRWAVGKPANEAVGPEYATGLWRERSDVRRLPPRAFYPVGWWEKGLLGGPYPAETYAVHHWAKGWGPQKVQESRKVADASFSILVAFRDPDGTRGRLWDFVRARLEREFPEAEIIVGTDDGDDPFHKTRAINRAAEEASGSILGIFDADTVVDAKAVGQAIEYASEHPERWCRPWTTKLRLSEAATLEVLALGEAWDGMIDRKRFREMEGHTSFQHSPPLVLHRSAFDKVGGMDERFQGWGQEDLAFSLALRRLVGLQKTWAGIAVHLWHPRIGRAGRDLWKGQDSEEANLALVAQYRKARSPSAMRALLEAGKVNA